MQVLGARQQMKSYPSVNFSLIDPDASNLHVILESATAHLLDRGRALRVGSAFVLKNLLPVQLARETRRLAMVTVRVVRAAEKSAQVSGFLFAQRDR